MDAAGAAKLDGVDLLLGFFEVAIHMILYIRGVYPPELFERRKKYGVPVQVNRVRVV